MTEADQVFADMLLENGWKRGYGQSGYFRRAHSSFLGNTYDWITYSKHSGWRLAEAGISWGTSKLFSTLAACCEALGYITPQAAGPESATRTAAELHRGAPGSDGSPLQNI